MTTTRDLFDAELIGRYALDGPRYTSYPSAALFNSSLGVDAYQGAIQRSNAHGGDLSLYVHIPFCDTVCFYCGCNKVITKNRNRADSYVEALGQELALQSTLFGQGRRIRQLHWGGGTPTFLCQLQIMQLMNSIGEHFMLTPDWDDVEYSIEIDPRAIDDSTIAALRERGFNRLSLGVQDVDPLVQQAVNRVQPREMTANAIRQARESGYKSISVDLIYGLPHQTVASYARTLDTIIDLAPDRLSVFAYSHLPHLFKMQRQIDSNALPSPAQRLAILQLVIERLSDAGYVYIGMDHFARPDDELAIAQRNGTLHRNFQGYSTHADCDVLGIGASSIGRINDVYAQNEKDVERYEARVRRGELPLSRGWRLSTDDQLRQDVIGQLMCAFSVRFAQVEATYGIRFSSYFEQELERLRALQADGLVSVDDEGIVVPMRGRLLIRNICMTFDRYVETSSIAMQYSKTV
ncbi:oxygen-independent coproporphyrinogen III oxidase [Mycetohabitans rhizoxinica]|uniref:Coproporphyrinogen-III oxidase n=1 Tax=Mycetohabitans rhizoxinica TaxID=412963 RepID=A0ABZ2Q5A8_9BURK